MTHAEPHPPAAPEVGELFFGHAELIYSRTDARGVIVSGNGVFCRMCGLDWPELIGAPHRKVRHPEMPRGFFHLFWSLLKQGKPAVGYVRNQHAGGGHYWVLAAAIPCEGGYFSVRIRPSDGLLNTIRTEYAALVRRERDEGLSPEASAAALLERLSALGFSTYDAFAADVFAREIHARDTQLVRPADAATGTLATLLGLLQEILDEQVRLVALFADLVLLPVNMRLVAARLEPQGGPISQISVNYKMASEEIARRLTDFVSGKESICGRMAQAVRHSLILTACARLQGELVDTYDRGDASYQGTDRRVEGIRLGDVMRDCLARALEALTEAGQLSAGLSEASTELRRMILGLDTIRILARVESRKSPESQVALTATIDRIDEVQGSISGTLKAMTDRSFAIGTGITSLYRGAPAGRPRVAADAVPPRAVAPAVEQKSAVANSL